MMRPQIRVDRGRVEGYGGPGYHWVRVTHGNVLLEHSKEGSEYEQGRAVARYELHWDREWEPEAFFRAIAGRPLASQPCTECGGDTLKGTHSVGKKVFCEQCADQIPAYQERLRAEAAQRATEREARHAAARAAEVSANQAAIAGAFHWRDGWYFKRSADGAVRVMKCDPNGRYLIPDLLIPEAEWASIVCIVSAGGETGERWDAARRFHGKPS